jgi:hypothetical protein
MPTTSGLTTFGIIRKRMADLYADFALRIKEGGVFGTQTTADLPDTFPTDPLVQIMTTTTASLHELWEAVEFYYAQLDPKTASGVFLDNLHGQRVGIARGVGQTDESYREAILSALARPTRNHIETVASARPDIDCAILLTSTVTDPIVGIPAPGNALVLKGCGVVDYNALAKDIYDTIELGPHQLHGDVIGSYAPNATSCATYRFFEADPIFPAMAIQGYFTATCGVTDIAAIKTTITATLNALYSACGLGAQLNAAVVTATLANLAGFIVTDVKLARRSRELWPMPCPDLSAATTVSICGVVTPWVTHEICGLKAGEVWCPPTSDCLQVKPWEYISIDPQFITVVEDATRGGCV